MTVVSTQTSEIFRPKQTQLNFRVKLGLSEHLGSVSKEGRFHPKKCCLPSEIDTVELSGRI